MTEKRPKVRAPKAPKVRAFARSLVFRLSRKTKLNIRAKKRNLPWRRKSVWLMIGTVRIEIKVKTANPRMIQCFLRFLKVWRKRRSFIIRMKKVRAFRAMRISWRFVG